MPENTTSDRAPDGSLSNSGSPWYQERKKIKKLESALFPPELDIDLWLEHNAPISFQQLADIRYALYHRCSRAEFTTMNAGEKEFKLTGRCSTLVVVNNGARHYLLSRLRKLGREKNWINAIPRTRKPRITERDQIIGRPV